LIWLFTEKLGKVSAIAKGAKKGNSKFMAVTQTFCYADYVIYKGKSLFSLNEGQVIDSFQDLLGDLQTLTYSSYVCELLDISLPEGESNRELFKEVITIFYLIKNGVGDIESLIRAFELKLLNATGYRMNMEYCCRCRKKIKKSNYLDMQYFAPVCDECDKSNCIKISSSTYNIIGFLNKLPLEKVHRVVLNEQVKKELYKILSNIISVIYLRRPKSLDMFNYLKGSDING
jgi:DNA repair protein RecO (recombination protein O)